MLQKRKVLLPALTTVVIALAIAVSYKALHQTEALRSPTTAPLAQLPSLPPTAKDSQTLDSLLEEDIESKLLPLALEDTIQDKEGLISFRDKESYLDFLSSLSSKGLTLIAQSDRLFAVRVGFSDLNQLEGIKGADISPNYAISVPAPPAASAQAGAVGFGNSALYSIGITGDNSAWGTGVTVAVIDSGVNDQIALKDGVTHLALTELAVGTEQLSHGTAVASIISGDHSSTPGVAPASDILSIRVTNSNGASDTFTLAQGIIAAVDGGAQIINISMGSPSSSSVLDNAVAYAQDQGAVIVASAGNEGIDTLSYPAAYSGVISVGAIEANGEHLDFSNQGDTLTITAPGYEVAAAWGEDLLTGFSGTSASAPFVSGAIAAIMSENPNYTAQQASDQLLQYVNEGGIPGNDPQYGGGTLDLGRALENGSPGIYDIAVTGQILQTDDNGNESLLVVVQNQGTETLFNSPVAIETPSGVTQVSINSLTAGETFTQTIPLNSSQIEDAFTTSASARLSTTEDIDPRNNTHQTSHTNIAK